MGMSVAGPRKMYLSIADGRFSLKVKEQTDLCPFTGNEPTTRSWKDDDGNTKECLEHRYTMAGGYITGIRFDSGQYGQQCLIDMQMVDDERGDAPTNDIICIALATKGRFFSEFAKKIASADVTQIITLRPHDDFVGSDGKNVRRSIAMTQGGEKLYNHFWDHEAKKNINGIPVPPKPNEDMDSDDWEMHFIQERKFLIAYLQEHVIPNIQPARSVAGDGESTFAAVAAEEFGDDTPF